MPASLTGLMSSRVSRTQRSVWPRAGSARSCCRPHAASLPLVRRRAARAAAMAPAHPVGRAFGALKRELSTKVEGHTWTASARSGEPGLRSAPLPADTPAGSHTRLACPRAGAAQALAPTLPSHLTLTLGSRQALLAPGSAPDLFGLHWSAWLVSARAPVIPREGVWVAWSHSTQVQRGSVLGQGPACWPVRPPCGVPASPSVE